MSSFPETYIDPVTSAKQPRDPCSGPLTKSTSYRVEFPLKLIGQTTNGFFNRSFVARTKNPDTQLGAENKDLGAGS